MADPWDHPLLQGIRKVPFYAGQICHVAAANRTGATRTPFDELPLSPEERAIVEHIARAFSAAPLYRHQAAVIQRLLDGKDVACLTGPDSGATTLCHLMAAIWYLARGGRVLRVVPESDREWSETAAWREGLERIPLLREMRTEQWFSGAVGKADDLADIVVTTPVRLSLQLHAGSQPEFFAQLGLVIWEELPLTLGRWGPDTAAISRRLWIACRRGGAAPRLLVTGRDFGNARGVVEATTVRRFEQGGWVDQPDVARARSLAVSWLPPLRSTENPGVYRRGHFLRDLKDLLGFLVAPEAGGSDTTIHYCVDASQSMEKRLKEALMLVSEDAQERIANGRAVRFSVFRDRGLQEEWPGVGMLSDVDSLQAHLGTIKSDGCTSIASALRGVARRAREDGATTVLLVSDGEDEITKEEAALVRKEWPPDAIDRFYYVSLGVMPHPTVRDLAVSLGVEIVETPAEAFGDIWRAILHAATGVLGSEVALLVFDGSVSERDLTGLPSSAKRKVGVYHDVEAFGARAGDVGVVVCVGYAGPVEDLRRLLTRTSRRERVLFLYTNEDPAVMTPHHFRHGEPLGLDRRPLLPVALTNQVAREKHLAALLEGGGVSAWELLQYLDIDPAGSEEAVRAQLSAAVLSLPGCWIDRDALRRRVSGFFHYGGGALPTLSEPLDHSLLRDSRPSLDLDRPSADWAGIDLAGGVSATVAMPLALLTYPGGDHVALPQGRYTCQWDLAAGSVELEEADGTDAPQTGTPIIHEETTFCIALKTVEGPVTNQSLQLEVRQVEARVNLVSEQYRPHRGAGAEQSLANQTLPIHWSGDLPAIVLSGPWLREGVGRTLALTLQNALRTIIPPPLAHALLFLPREESLWILELYPYGGIGLSDLLMGTSGLLERLFRLVREVLLTCPCGLTSQTGSGAETRDGCGCCVYSPFSALSWTGDPVPSKKGLLTALDQHLPRDASASLRRREKYDGITDEDRLAHAEPPDLGPLPAIRTAYGTKFGFAPPLPAVGFIADATAARRPGLLGLYRPRGRKIFLRSGLAQAVALDVTAHEFAHYWQHLSDGFSPSLVGKGIPHHGKLFSEGSAEWLAVHILQAFSLRQQIAATDLRKGDEYGDGFRLLKYLESHFGTNAVFDFLRSGNIARATDNKFPDLNELYLACGLHRLAQIAPAADPTRSGT